MYNNSTQRQVSTKCLIKFTVRYEILLAHKVIP